MTDEAAENSGAIWQKAIDPIGQGPGVVHILHGLNVRWNFHEVRADDRLVDAAVVAELNVAACDHISVVSIPSKQTIKARAADQCVIAIAAGEKIVAVAADQTVAPASAIKGVVASPGVDDVCIAAVTG